MVYMVLVEMVLGYALQVDISHIEKDQNFYYQIKKITNVSDIRNWGGQVYGATTLFP